MQYEHLQQYPSVFKSVTGLTIPEFDELWTAMIPRYVEAEWKRLERANRQRALGAGHPFELAARDQILMSVVWLRVYPVYEVLGYLFGVSDTTAGRSIKRGVTLLAEAGHDTMRLPDPGKKKRRKLDDLLRQTPELVVVIDSFEQRIQRPRDKSEADQLYSGKKKAHTLKSQVAVDETTGQVVDVSESVPGPTADITLLETSQLMKRLPPGVGGIGDLAYVGIDKLGLGASPRRKPPGKNRPPDDVAFNTAFSRRRIVVEHTLSRFRRYQALAQTDRQHRQGHTARVLAVAGLVNRQLSARFAA
jgi:hypothetical protein